MFNILSKKNLFSIILIVLSFSFLLYAFPTGITGVTLKNGSGCNCHAAEPFSNVIVTIVGPDELTAEQTASYSVTISGGPLAAAGTNIAASLGTLANIGSDLQIISGELTHTSPKSPSNNMVTFQFNYTAPNEAGQITLYANGNSVNLNGNNTGDQWNFAPNKTITITSTTDVNDDEITVDNYKLYQNYPNPFNPATTISWNMKESGNVVIKVYDVTGNEVALLIDEFKAAGKNSIELNASDFASGIYFYKITTADFSDIKKMVLMK